MPELPEVETVVKELNQKVRGRTFINVWTDFKKNIKKPKNFEEFSKEIKGKKIKKIWRRGKNILIELSNEKVLLVHQKLTGHFLVGVWEKKGDLWYSKIKGPLSEDPMNRFLHLIFWLDNGEMLGLSDLRKFAKIELLTKEELEKEIGRLGPDPLDKKFTLEKFKEKLRKKKGPIKKILMDQEVIAGIGNIYSDEILWRSKIHPLKKTSKLSEKELEKIFKETKKVLKKAIALGGESISDFRRTSGEKGLFDQERKVYRRQGEKCFHCQDTIQRIKIGGRSNYFCPNCQKL